MKAFTRLAVTCGGLAACANAACAAFTFSLGTPNRTLLPGRIVVPLYALNDGVGGTGTRLKAFAPVFGAVGGKILINADNGGTPGDASDDAIDIPNAAGPNLAANPPTAGNGFSYVRVGAAAQTFQTSVTPALADDYAGGVSTFGVAVVTTAPASVPADNTVNNGLGLRVAVLVFTGSTTGFTFSGQIGGETGTAQTIPFGTADFVPEPTTLAAFGLCGVGMMRRRPHLPLGSGRTNR